jgi:hypothetical protein
MIDHLLVFPDEATARADPVVGAYYVPAQKLGLVTLPGKWRGSCLPGVSVYAVTATATVTDPTTGQSYVKETRTPYPGWFMVISRLELNAALRDLANNGCVLIADRAAAAAGNPNFLLFKAANLTDAEIAAAHVEPTFLGSRYPF